MRIHFLYLRLSSKFSNETESEIDEESIEKNNIVI